MPKGIKASPLARSMSLKSPRSDQIKIKQDNYQKASGQLPPLKQQKEDQDSEIQSLIKKNLIHDKASFGKIQLHNKTINSKVSDPSIPPERYHSSKLL